MTEHKSPHLAYVILLLENEQGNRTKRSAHHSISTLSNPSPKYMPTSGMHKLCPYHYAGTDRSRDDEAGLGIRKKTGGVYGRCSSEKIRFKVSSAYPFLSHRPLGNGAR